MAIAGLHRPSAPGSDTEFTRVFGLVAPSYRKAPPPPFLDGPLRVQQLAAHEPAFLAAAGSIACWIEGRLFNLDSLRREHGFSEARGAAELLARALARGPGALEAVLRDADGDFFAALYDPAEGRAGTLRLCTDRLGLKPGYVYSEGATLFFCSRQRGALGLDGFSPKIDPRAAGCFLDLGHLLGTGSWFQGMERVPPATVLAVDLATGAQARARTWRWSDIATASNPPSLDEAVDEFLRLLRDAVARRVLPGETPSVMLSGGLDSRALLACLPPERCGGTATMGQPGCRDLMYAARVARAAGVSHRELLFTPENWERNRFHALWKCDGMSSVADLMSSQFSNEMRALGTVNLNGFAGDLVAGGSYLRAGYLDVPADRAFAETQYGAHAALAPGADDHSRAPHTDPYVLAQRVRLMTVAGTLEAEDASEQRKPFMDNALLEFLYSLPDGMRRDGRLYRRALLRLRPDLFAEIPWQQTGLPLGAETGLAGYARVKALRLVQRLGLSRRPAGFQDLPRWVRGAAGRYDALLRRPDALWREFIHDGRERFDVPALLRAGDVHGLLRAVSLEVWLRQVFHNEYRAPDVPEPDTLEGNS